MDAAFLASGKPRPDNKKYGHPSVRDALNTISFHKCFYCERKLKKYFQGEFIRADRNSAKGYRTIQEHKLDSPVLDHLRLEPIKRFQQVLRSKDSCLADGRKEMNDAAKMHWAETDKS